MLLKKYTLFYALCIGFVGSGISVADVNYHHYQDEVHTDAEGKTKKSISEQKWSINFGLGASKSDQKEIVALVCGYATSLVIIGNFIRMPRSLWDFFATTSGVVLTTHVTGSLLSAIYKPFIDFLCDTFSNDNDDKDIIMRGDSFKRLITEWNKVKTDLPEPLRAKFDMLFNEYQKNKKLTMTEEQVATFFKEVVQEINWAHSAAA